MSKLLLQAFIAVTFFSPFAAVADDMDFGGLKPEEIAEPSSVIDTPLPSDAKPSLNWTPGSPEPMNSENAASSGTSISTSRAPQSKWGEIRRNIGVGYFNYATVDTSEVNRGRGQLTTYNYLTLEYRLGRGEKVFFRPAFLLDSAGEDLRGAKLESRLTWSDVYFGYSSYNLPWLPFNMDYKTEIRAYLPTSDTSQSEGMIARLRGDLKAHYPLSNRLTFLLWFKPDYFFQRLTAKTNARGFANGTRHYGYDLSANLYYQMRGGVFGFGSSVAHEQTWTHESEIERLEVFRREDVAAQVFLGINAAGFFSHIGVEQSRNVSRPRDEFVAFRDTEMQYFARSYYRF